ncbi:imidazole glycerol phosphate synthase subunit HisF [Bacteroidaceae bacterium]|nr:imidazole glycerol phosphate synthase subunit HisF [Bacteroidaceae bacterium]
MLKPRIIPCLLVHNGGLVKTVNFRNPKYVGDPINAVRIFNEKEADELMVLDIDATVNGAEPNFKMIDHLANESQMPLCYGGGVKSVDQIRKIVGLGVEKVAISSAALESPAIVEQASMEVGSQSVVVVIDVMRRKGFFSKGWNINTHNGKKTHNQELSEFVKQMEDAGAGEIVLNSIDKDGAMSGYDVECASMIKMNIDIPLTVLGGAGDLSHMVELFSVCGLVGAAAGSLFVFKGKYRAVLINYPAVESKDELAKIAYV